MLSGGMAGQFRELRRGKPMKVVNPRLAPKGAGHSFPLSHYFGANSLTVSRFFDRMELPSTSPPQIRAIRSFLRPSFKSIKYVCIHSDTPDIQPSFKKGQKTTLCLTYIKFSSRLIFDTWR